MAALIYNAGSTSQVQGRSPRQSGPAIMGPGRPLVPRSPRHHVHGKFNAPRPNAAGVSAPATPPLQNGDRLTRTSSMRRYAAMPDLQERRTHRRGGLRAVARFAIDTTAARTLRPHYLAGPCTRLGTPGVESERQQPRVRLDLDNAPQPDAFLIVLPDARRPGADRRGRLHRRRTRNWSRRLPLQQRQHTTCTPSSTPTAATASANTSSGACSTGQIDWFVLREGRYDPLAPAAADRSVPQRGLPRSVARPGRPDRRRHGRRRSNRPARAGVRRTRRLRGPSATGRP